MPLDLEHRLEAEPALGERLHGRPGEDEISGPAAGLVASAIVHSPHELGVESDAGGEAEAAPIRAAQRDPPGVRRGKPARRLDGVARDPERTWKHARAAAGDEAERDASVAAVQRLVEATVTREDIDPLGSAQPCHELVACPPRSVRRTSATPRVRATCSTSGSVTLLARGLTIRTLCTPRAYAFYACCSRRRAASQSSNRPCGESRYLANWSSSSATSWRSWKS